MSKLQKVLVVLALFISVFIAGGFVGYTWCKSSGYRGVIEQQQQDAEDVDKHNTETYKVNENVAKTITIIKKITDPTGCLDINSPDEYIDGLLNADRATQYVTD